MTCKDCIHYEVCRDRLNQFYEDYGKLQFDYDDKHIEKCEVGLGFQDRNKFVKLPSTVKLLSHIEENKNNKLYPYSFIEILPSIEWVRLCSTKEEAEKALAERSENNG